MATKVPKNIPVAATIKFPLVDESITVDIQKGLARLKGEELIEILSDDGAVRTDSSLYRIIHALTKVSEQLGAMFKRYVAEHQRVSSKLLDTRGYGLDGDGEPEMTVLAIGQLRSWMRENKPRVLEQAGDLAAPPAPASKARSPGL